MMTRRSSVFARGLAALLATTSVLHVRGATAGPADIFSSPAPVIGSDPPKAEDVKDGDTNVATQTGAVQYAYPIQVPPGRNGMAPSLSLSYSSQAPLYGTNLGAGWTLNIPRIEEDVSHGRLKTHSPGVEASQGSTLATADDRFTSSLAGGRPLVAITSDPTAPNVLRYYRAQSDATFARYQRMDATQPFRWRVLTTDGSTLYFGDAANAPFCPISDGYAPLTRQVDAFGNEVSYQYAMAGLECVLTSITWGQNSGASLQAFAGVTFNYERAEVCPGTNIQVGSQRVYRTWPDPQEPSKLLVSGANKLTSIEVRATEPSNQVQSAPTVHTRLITLGYSAAEEQCSPPNGQALDHSPIRYLTSVQESAWGVDSPRVDLPAVTFSYGLSKIDLIDPNPGAGVATPWGDPANDAPTNNFAWGYRHTDDRWPTVEAMMLDIDGDGLPDRIQNGWWTDGSGTSCGATWQRNDPTTSHFRGQQYLTFGDSFSPKMPRLRWQGSVDSAAFGTHNQDRKRQIPTSRGPTRKLVRSTVR